MPSRAQEGASPFRMEADTVLLSETHQADSLIRRYQVNSMGEGKIELYYRINLSTLNKSYKENQVELVQLGRLMQPLASDSLHHLKRVVVKGFASPDGTMALNERLAKARMNDAVAYLKGDYPQLANFPIESSWAVNSWQEVLPALSQRGLEEREEAIRIVDSSMSDAEKQQHLQRLPRVWELLVSQVLPELRYVELLFHCEKVSYFEQRSYVAPPKPAPKPEAENTSLAKSTDPCKECLVVDEGITGIIVEVEE